MAYSNGMSRRTTVQALAAAGGLTLAASTAQCTTFGSDPDDARDAGPEAANIVADAGVPDSMTASEAGPKRIFLTKGDYSGDLVAAAKAAGRYDGGGGLVAGDALCELEARDIPSAKRWRAWLSVVGTGASSRFEDQGPRVDVSGEVVLPRIGANAKILIADRGGRTDGGARKVWTATSGNGLPSAPNDCGRWSAGPGAKGAGGDPSSLEKWTEAYYAEFCETSARLYCVED